MQNLVVLWDDQGRVCLATTTPELHYSDPLEVEFLIILQGLQVYLPLCIKSLIGESDSLLAFQAFEEDAESCASYSNAICEILALKERFNSCYFQYVSRRGNHIAHRLVQFACQVHDLTIWWDSLTNFVLFALWIGTKV